MRSRARVPYHLGVFHRNSNSMEISFHSHLDSNTVIATKFCTWHDSCAVVACAKKLLRSDGQQRNYGKAKFLHRIWIAGKKTLVKWVPGPTTHNQSVHPCSYPFLRERDIFSIARIPEIKKEGCFFKVGEILKRGINFACICLFSPGFHLVKA